MSLPALRSRVLQSANDVHHLGLRWDRFNPTHDDGREREQFNRERTKFFESFEQFSGWQEYEKVFAAWRSLLEARNSSCKEWQVVGRLCFGAGDESVLEVGIRFHHTYGVPVIPGLSLIHI